jgi:hypothetical protein
LKGVPLPRGEALVVAKILNPGFYWTEVMAQHEHLPIYREAFEFLIYCETIVRHFLRYHKYTHGSDLRDTALAVIKLIIRGNNLNEKEQALEELRVTIEELKVIIHICKEVKAFNNFHSFETAVNQVTDISRQGEGWLKTARKKR